MALIPQETIDQIRDTADILDIVSDYVDLKRRGRNFFGLCPFHVEKTPSFSVAPEKQIFHCFGCGVGGNAFTFLCRLEGMSFPEAVRQLASKAGVVLPQAADDPHAREQARLYRLNLLAKTYFRRCLLRNAGIGARRYMEERGLNVEVAERFQLGYAPAGREGLVRFLSVQRAPLAEAVSLSHRIAFSPGKACSTSSITL
mgnify:CR=1 FL=1